MNTGEQVNVPLGNVETHQLATFADDSSLVSGAKPEISSYSPWRSFAEESRTHGILDILSRPVLLTDSSSLWSTSKLQNTYPTDALTNSIFAFPDAILNKSPNIVRKLQNFTYFRADVKVRIMVNAQAFSQGKLWIWFSPYELGNGTQTSADNLAAKTGYPGVELDVASGVPVEFTIPYCAPHSHYILTTGQGTMGDLFLTVLSPLTIADASISVFAWFENIDLSMPTGVERGILPSQYYAIGPNDVFGLNSTEINSPVWNNELLLLNRSNKVTLVKSLLIVTTSGNFILLPAGMRISALKTTTDTQCKIFTESVPLGLSGFLVSGATGTDYETSVVSAASSTFGWIDEYALSIDSPLYIYQTSVSIITSTLLSIPNVAQIPLNTERPLSGYLVSFRSSNKQILIYPPYAKTTYAIAPGPTVSINSNTVTGTLCKFGSITGTLFKYISNLNTADTFVISQSSDSKEDEWYKNFPRAQASESEVLAMTGVVTNAYKTIRSMSKLPMLSSLISPLNWMQRLGTLASSGFSKPADVQALQPFYQLPAKGFTHITGQDCSVALAAVPDNSIGVNPGVFSSAIDEMDINYICKKSCFLRNDSWSNTSTGKIYSIFVSPGICKVSGTLFQPSLLAYVTSMFRYWHGTMRYRISVAKTGFHTGRLRISYHPGAFTTSITYPADNAYSWILDLSVSSEIDVEIPFVSSKPWLSCDLFSDTSVNPFGPAASAFSIIGSHNLQFCTGVLQIEVLNQLRVAGAASNTVDILTWVSAGDIEYAVPIMSSFVPAKESTTPVTLLARSKREVVDNEIPVISDELLAEYLSATEDGPPNTEEDVSEEDLPEAQAFQNITPASDHMTQLDGSEFCSLFKSQSAFADAKTLCIGESVSNLRELTRRFVPYCLKVGTANSVTPFSVTFDPAWFGSLTSASFPQRISVYLSKGVLVGSYTNCTSPIEYISKIFRFWRGSRRYKAYVGDANTGDSAIQNFMNQARLSTITYANGNVEPPAFATSASPPEDVFDINSTFSHFCDGTTNKVCEITAPYYADTPIQCVSDGTNFTDADSYAIRNKVIFDAGSTSTTNAKQVLYYTAAGDDFSFGYLIGAPLLRRVVTPFRFPVT